MDSSTRWTGSLLSRRTNAFAFAMSVCAALAGFTALGACGSGDGRAPGGAEAGVDRVAAAPGLTREAGAPEAALIADASVDAIAEASADGSADGGSCNVRVEAPPLLDSPHVTDGTTVAYNSNPPSSGPHYSSWANFQELTHVVDDGYLVHSMEHGAVLLLYSCQAASCDALVAALRAVRDAIPTDPQCDPAMRVRVILAPRPMNDVAVAAAAWGHVYKADCMDAASLTQFVLDHYAKAPENFCFAGQVF